MSNAIPMLEYADFEVEVKHKEVAVNHFYDYIHAEQDMAGEMLQTKRLQINSAALRCDLGPA